MKKIGILLAMLLVAGVCAMADDAVAVQDDLLFADIDAVVLSQAEMEAVEGEGAGFLAYLGVAFMADTVTYWVTGESAVRSVIAKSGEAIDKWASEQPAPNPASSSRAIARARSRD